MKTSVPLARHSFRPLPLCRSLLHMSPSNTEEATQYFPVQETASIAQLHCCEAHYGQNPRRCISAAATHLLKFHSACRLLFNAMEMLAAMLMAMANKNDKKMLHRTENIVTFFFLRSTCDILNLFHKIYICKMWCGRVASILWQYHLQTSTLFHKHFT